MHLVSYIMKARLNEPAARHYVIAGIVRGAKPSPPKKKKMLQVALRRVIRPVPSLIEGIFSVVRSAVGRRRSILLERNPSPKKKKGIQFALRLAVVILAFSVVGRPRSVVGFWILSSAISQKPLAVVLEPAHPPLRSGGPGPAGCWRPALGPSPGRR